MSASQQLPDTTDQTEKNLKEFGITTAGAASRLFATVILRPATKTVEAQQKPVSTLGKWFGKKGKKK